jgi:hypothetical protein
MKCILELIFEESSKYKIYIYLEQIKAPAHTTEDLQLCEEAVLIVMPICIDMVVTWPHLRV